MCIVGIRRLDCCSGNWNLDPLEQTGRDYGMGFVSCPDTQRVFCIRELSPADASEGRKRATEARRVGQTKVLCKFRRTTYKWGKGRGERRMVGGNELDSNARTKNNKIGEEACHASK